jgi:predicted RNase H-like HicB family nuclease
MTALFVEYRQDSENDWWTATVREEPSVVTQGRTLQEAHDRVRKAIDLVRGQESHVPLTGETVWLGRDDLDEEVLRVAKQEGDLRVRLLQVQDELELATRDAVNELVKDRHLSYRVVGRLLGITHQRIEQIAKSLAYKKKENFRMNRS